MGPANHSYGYYHITRSDAYNVCLEIRLVLHILSSPPNSMVRSNHTKFFKMHRKKITLKHLLVKKYLSSLLKELFDAKE